MGHVMSQMSWFQGQGMLLTLWLACVSYLAPLNKRPRPVARAAAMLALALAAGGALAWLQPLQMWVPLTAIFVLSVLFFLVCGDMPLSGVLYAAVWAQLTQQLVAETCLLIFWIVSPKVDWGPSAWLLITDMDMNSTSLLFPVSLWLAQCYCTTMLYFQYTLFFKSAIKKELEILNALWHQKEEQYRLSKETIAIINRKCHDMKHQLAAVRAMPGTAGRERYLREAEESIGIYDAMFQTGNRVSGPDLWEIRPVPAFGAAT